MPLEELGKLKKPMTSSGIEPVVGVAFHLKVCDNGGFVIRILCWMFSFLWSVYKVSNFSETLSVSVLSRSGENKKESCPVGHTRRSWY
jgi:hypothetical protein